MKDYKVYAHGSADGWLHELLILVIVLSIPFFQYLGMLPLMDPDEGRYAEIAREMLERGDLITPTLNYVPYFEKPPLLYWANAASIKIFGLNEFAARFPSALCGLLTVLATYLIARRLYDRRTALLSAAILATSAGFVLQSRIILTDMMLTFWLTAALGTFLVASQRYERPRDSSVPWYLFYLFCALAVLTKGLIGIVFPAGILFFFLLLTRRWELLARMRFGTGLLLFLVVAAPWFVMVSVKNPGFARFFFIHEHFERFTSTVHGRSKPFWFFVPVLAVTMLPWSFFIPAALAKAWREQGREAGRSGLYLLIWIVVIFLFFSKSDSMLTPYVLPIFPPLAILVAHRIKGELERRGRGLLSATRVLGAALVMLGIAALGYAWVPPATARLADFLPSQAGSLNQFINHAPRVSIATCIIMGALLLIQGVVALACAARKPGRVLMVLLACSFLIEILVPRLIMDTIAQAESPRDLALKAASFAGPQTRIVTIGPMQAVSWYTGQRVLVAGMRDELEFGSKQGDQSAWFPDPAALLGLWRGKVPLLIILGKKDFNYLHVALHPKPRIVMESGQRLLISNR
ncbi:MAG: phospholipid carrier-dependent glycosyltransferase [Desulfuromonadales bacterium]|nr:phospholipid carrier-dependent glycosyltransferase [Desulfuromonadales bacterium]